MNPLKPGVARDTKRCWCPPKPLVGVRPIDKVLNRHTVVTCPESRLVVAVIVSAIDDCLAPCTKPRRQARRFLLGDELTHWCDLVGLNPEFVRFVAKKAGYLADEKQHWRRLAKKTSSAKAHPDQNTPAKLTPATGRQGDLS